MSRDNGTVVSLAQDNGTVVLLALHVCDVRRRGGLVVHPRVGSTGWTVSTASGFTLGSACFDDIETADEFAKRAARFRVPWRTVTLAQWRDIQPRIGARLATIATDLGGLVTRKDAP